MFSRISKVQNIDIITLQLSSVFFVGDCVALEPEAKVFAVQREFPIYSNSEDEFDPGIYPIFNRPIPPVPMHEEVQMTVENQIPRIEVGNVDVIGISTSAIFQVGSNSRINIDVRVKHTRQFLVTKPVWTEDWNNNALI